MKLVVLVAMGLCTVGLFPSLASTAPTKLIINLDAHKQLWERERQYNDRDCECAHKFLFKELGDEGRAKFDSCREELGRLYPDVVARSYELAEQLGEPQFQVLPAIYHIETKIRAKEGDPEAAKVVAKWDAEGAGLERQRIKANASPIGIILLVGLLTAVFFTLIMLRDHFCRFYQWLCMGISTNVRRGLIRLWITTSVPWTAYWGYQFIADEKENALLLGTLLPIGFPVLCCIGLWVWRGFLPGIPKNNEVGLSGEIKKDLPVITDIVVNTPSSNRKVNKILKGVGFVSLALVVLIALRAHYVSVLEFIGFCVLSEAYFRGRKRKVWWGPGVAIISIGVILEIGFALYLRAINARF